jgi:5-methylcytosine-specific restriction protein B
MSPSDAVRSYVVKRYIAPARMQGVSIVSVCAGDVHRALGFSQRSALVCGALGSLLFQNENAVRLISRTGPGVGMTTTFTFEV